VVFALPGGIVLTEVELLCRFAAQGVADELLVASRAEIVAEVFVRGRIQIRIELVYFFLQQLADRFHVVLVEVGFREHRGILSSEHLHLDDVALIVSPRSQLLTADITRDMQHERVTLP